MCRYSDHDYRTHYACLACRHAAKFGRSVKPRCPTCQVEMVDLGRDFAAPRRLDSAQWRKITLLVAAGVRFDSCGCDGPGPRPRSLGEARHPIMGPGRRRYNTKGVSPAF